MYQCKLFLSSQQDPLLLRSGHLWFLGRTLPHVGTSVYFDFLSCCWLKLSGRLSHLRVGRSSTMIFGFESWQNVLRWSSLSSNCLPIILWYLQLISVIFHTYRNLGRILQTICSWFLGIRCYTTKIRNCWEPRILGKTTGRTNRRLRKRPYQTVKVASGSLVKSGNTDL